MIRVFSGNRPVHETKQRESVIDRAAGIDRNPKSGSNTTPAVPTPGGGGKGQTTPKVPTTKPKDGKADGIGRNPKEL